MKKRIDWIDCAKGYGIILVLLAHTSIFSALKIEIYTFHMPLFFFLAGYVYSINNQKNFATFFIKKVKTIIIPYFSFGTILIFYLLIVNGLSLTNFLVFIKALILQQRFLTLWFIACLFFVEIIFYFILKATRKNNKKILLTLVFSAFLSFLYYKYVNQNLYWNIDACLTAIPFFGLGYVVKNNNYDILEKMTKLKYIVLLWIINIVAGYINYKLYLCSIDIFYNIYNNFCLYYVSSISGVLAFVLLVKILPSVKKIQFIGENSIIYYALHQSLIFPLIYRLYYLLNVFQHYGQIELFISSIITTLLTLVVLTYVQKKIKTSKLSFIVGK